MKRIILILCILLFALPVKGFAGVILPNPFFGDMSGATYMDMYILDKYITRLSRSAVGNTDQYLHDALYREDIVFPDNVLPGFRVTLILNTYFMGCDGGWCFGTFDVGYSTRSAPVPSRATCSDLGVPSFQTAPDDYFPSSGVNSAVHYESQGGAMPVPNSYWLFDAFFRTEAGIYLATGGTATAQATSIIERVGSDYRCLDGESLSEAPRSSLYEDDLQYEFYEWERVDDNPEVMALYNFTADDVRFEPFRATSSCAALTTCIDNRINEVLLNTGVTEIGTIQEFSNLEWSEAAWSTDETGAEVLRTDIPASDLLVQGRVPDRATITSAWGVSFLAHAIIDRQQHLRIKVFGGNFGDAGTQNSIVTLSWNTVAGKQ